jgi:hypothetical protein
MKRKDVSSEAEDPSLGDGIAFFSQVDAYMAHLEQHWDLEQEVRHLRSSTMYADPLPPEKYLCRA